MRPKDKGIDQAKQMSKQDQDLELYMTILQGKKDWGVGWLISP
jgi:hypothetical protein